MADEHDVAPVVFLLGAGASADAGCPTVVNLVEGFQRFVEKQDPKRAAALSAILELMRESPAVRDHRLLVDVELLLATIRALSDRENNFISPFVRHWRQAVRECAPSLSELDKLLQRFIRQQCTVDPKRVKYLWPIADFVGLYQKLDVFTLNYDASIEIVCQQREIPYTDGFDLYWNPTQFDSPRNKLRLFKLHGSLLWYATSGAPRRLVKIPIRATGAHEIKFFTDEAVSDILIYPALSKEQHVEPYATLMAQFRDALSRAAVIVAIGCSFRDQYIKQIILERMLLNPDLQLVVVDPDAALMLARSDTALAADWTFDAVRHRVSLLDSSARAAFGGHELLNHVRNISELPNRRRAYENSVLSGDRQVSYARTYVSRLIDTHHVGAIAQLLQDSGYTPAVRLELTGTHFDTQESARLFPPMLLVLTLSRSAPLRREARAWLDGHVRWLFQYLVRKAGPVYQPLTPVQTGVEADPDPDSFFGAHADRISESLYALEQWANLMGFGLPEATADSIQELLFDLELALKYFDGAPGSTAVFQTPDGSVTFPMGTDDDIMLELGERCSANGLPLSLRRLFEHAQPRPSKRRS